MKVLGKTLFVIILVLIVSTACSIPFTPKMVRGSGEIVVEERNVTNFDKILVTGAGRVIITQGESESLTIETDDNLIEFIETGVNGKTLEIGFTDNSLFSSRVGGNMFDPSDGFIFRISVIDLTAITVSGAAKIEVDKLKTDRLNIVFSGAGDIGIEDLVAEDLDIQVSGAGDIYMVGYVETQSVSLTGFGRYKAFDLESQQANITISGAGDAEVWANESLDVTISGAGNVQYYGSPKLNRDVGGLGRIQSMGDK
jgi:hypothetical protein